MWDKMFLRQGAIAEFQKNLERPSFQEGIVVDAFRSRSLN
jgi:hypothetical protein